LPGIVLGLIFFITTLFFVVVPWIFRRSPSRDVAASTPSETAEATEEPSDHLPVAGGRAGRAYYGDGAAQAGVVIIADHGSVAAQHIHEVTMNPPPSQPDSPASQ